jgi:hypothetical protein
MSRLVALALVVTVAACRTEAKKASPGASLPWGAPDGAIPDKLEGSPTLPHREFDFGVYLPWPASPAALGAARQDAAERLKGVTILTLPDPRSPPTALVLAPPISRLPAPPLDFIRSDGRGFRPGDADAVARSQGLIALAFRLDEDPGLARLRAAQSVALDAARAGGGAIWDESTREIYAADEWAKVRIDGWEGELPDVRRHISLHYDDAMGGGRLFTLGMQKFGLPDLAAVNVTRRDIGNATRILDGVAQVLVEGARVEGAGDLTVQLGAIRHAAARRALLDASDPTAVVAWTVTLVPVSPRRGDADNRIVLLQFPQNGFPQNEPFPGQPPPSPPADR